MTKYLHFAHCNKVFVKTGQKVGYASKIAELGRTGTNSPHLHFECHKVDPLVRGVSKYSYGMSRQECNNVYENPVTYMTSTIPTKWHHTGYGFMQYVTDKSGNYYHPGIDINGPGDDLGQPIYSPVNGIVHWSGNSSGWGNHFYIKINEQVQGDEDTMALKDTLTESSLKKMKEMAFIMGINTGDGKDMKDYLSVEYNGKPLGEQNWKALLDYMWNHKARRAKIDYLNDNGELDKLKGIK